MKKLIVYATIFLLLLTGCSVRKPVTEETTAPAADQTLPAADETRPADRTPDETTSPAEPQREEAEEVSATEPLPVQTETAATQLSKPEEELVVMETIPPETGSVETTVYSEPTEPQATADGRICVARIFEIDVSIFSNSTEITLDEEGESVVMYADGLIEDVVLERGSWDAAGVDFTPEEVLFTAPRMDSSDMVLIHTYFGDAMPHLRVTFTGRDGQLQRFLFQSGKDGSILLTE